MAYNLKEPEEVKEYLKNLGIEYRFGCYSEKNPEVCHLLGDYLEAIEKAYQKAAKVYQFNCDDYKFSKSCYKYGAYLLLGRGVPKADFTEAYKYMEKGCNSDNPMACFHQGLLLVSRDKNITFDRDPIKAMSLFEKACLGQNANACYYLSGMYISGVKQLTAKKEDESVDAYLVQKNMEKAFKFGLEACNLGNLYACTNVSQMYRRGHGVEKSVELADKYKKMALEIQQEMDSNKTLSFGQGLSN